MRAFLLLVALATAGLPTRPALADMRVAIAGAAPVLPAAFTPRDRRLIEAAIPAATVRPTAPESIVWMPPLVDRHLSAAEKTEDLAPDLLEAILRIEGLYDPTRVDLVGEPAGFEVRAGTASMNNVFADRWDLADTDPNVDYNVRYLAQAWMRTQAPSCDMFTKNRSSYGGPTLSALSVADCARVVALRAEHGDTRPLIIAQAALDVPVFAAPLPGARLSSDTFWAAQKARIQAIQDRLRGKWEAATIAVAPKGQ